MFVAFFNLDDKPVTLHFTWVQLGLDGSKNGAQNIFNGSKSKSTKEVEISLPAHGSTVYRNLVSLNSRAK